MKYVPTTTQANDVNGLRNWTVNELHRLASSLTNEDAASSGDLDAEIAAREAADSALAAQIEDLYVSTDGSNRTYAQTSAPSSPNIGDLWFDTDNNNILSRWSGSAWAAVDDARIAANAAAIVAEITARQTADTTLTAAVNSLGGRATNLEATVNSATDGNLALKARVSTEETARASGDTALASRASSLEATVNNATTGVTATAARLTTEETARATADSALASRATALEATVNSATDGNVALKARVATEESARASGDTAIASSVTSLTATVNNNYSTLNAAVSDEQAARASADNALASRASSLEATVNNATDGNLALKARIASEESARATADTALATRASSLEATVNSSSTGNAALQSRIASEESARATADTALATRATSLEATVGSATLGNSALQARIASEESARATADSALATRATSLEATVNSGTTGNAALQARIAAEESARASGDSANATQINTVSATASSKNRTFAEASTPTAQAIGDLWMNASDSNKMYRWDGSSWVTVDDARIQTTAAAVTNEVNARVSGDNALSSQITTVSTNVNGLSASVSSLSSSVNGLSARYGVSLNVNGHITGFVQNNDGSQGDFTVVADSFRVINPGASSTPAFEVSGGVVRIRNDVIGTSNVQTDNVAAGAITRAAVASYPNQVVPPGDGSWATVGSVSLNVTSGTLVRLDASMNALVQSSTAGSALIEGRWVRDNAVIFQTIMIEATALQGIIEVGGDIANINLSTTNSANPTVVWVDTPGGPRSVEWTFQVRRTGDGNITKAVLLATEIRR